MKRLGGTDLEEYFLLTPGTTAPQLMSHQRRHLDARGRYMIQMVQAWGQMALLSDAMSEIGHCAGDTGDKPPVRRPSQQEIVLLAAEMVESTFEEAKRRGWIVETDIQE